MRTQLTCVGHLITKILIEIVQGHISLSVRPCYVSPKGTPARPGGGQQSYPRSAQQTPHATPQTPHTRQAAPIDTPARPTGTTCFKCGETGHYTNVCPKRNPNTPARDNSQGKQTQTLDSNRGYNIARVNQINVEATRDGPNIVIATLFINSVPATIFFDSGAWHSFIYDRYVHANSLPYLALRRPMIVITPKGAYEATYMSHKIEVTILGRNFWAMPIVLEESAIELILGMNWLNQCKAVIHCARGTIELSSPNGDRFEVTVAPPTSNKPVVYMINGKFVGDHIKIVREFSDVFPEELPGMSPDREVEFVIDLSPGTPPISKRPYRMSVEELKELKKQLTELHVAGYFRPSSSHWGA
jgi:predicted aspartyl protease